MSLIYFQQRFIIFFVFFPLPFLPLTRKDKFKAALRLFRNSTSKWRTNFSWIVNANSVECIAVILCCLFSRLLLQVSCFIPNPPSGRSQSGGLPTWRWVTQLCSAYTRHVSIHRHGKGWRTKQTLMVNAACQRRRVYGGTIHVFWKTAWNELTKISHSIEITVKLLLWNRIILKFEVIAYVTRIIPFCEDGPRSMDSAVHLTTKKTWPYMGNSVWSTSVFYLLWQEDKKTTEHCSCWSRGMIEGKPLTAVLFPCLS